VQATGHRSPFEEADWAQPYNWTAGGPPPDKGNHPVVLVSWREAMAFRGWLAEQWAGRLPAGYTLRLPTEAEWEKAARGGLEIPSEPVIVTMNQVEGAFDPAGQIPLQPNPAPQRRWPWGEWDDASPLRCANTSESQRQQTMVVGSFPDGVSPYGCLDMAGNVWEWSLSQFRPYPYRGDGRNDPTGEGNRALRGGAWFSNGTFARVSYRNLNHPDNFGSYVSFRVVVAPA